MKRQQCFQRQRISRDLSAGDGFRFPLQRGLGHHRWDCFAEPINRQIKISRRGHLANRETNQRPSSEEYLFSSQSSKQSGECVWIQLVSAGFNPLIPRNNRLCPAHVMGMGQAVPHPVGIRKLGNTVAVFVGFVPWLPGTHSHSVFQSHVGFQKHAAGFVACVWGYACVCMTRGWLKLAGVWLHKFASAPYVVCKAQGWLKGGICSGTYRLLAVTGWQPRAKLQLGLVVCYPHLPQMLAPGCWWCWHLLYPSIREWGSGAEPQTSWPVGQHHLEVRYCVCGLLKCKAADRKMSPISLQWWFPHCPHEAKPHLDVLIKDA